MNCAIKVIIFMVITTSLLAQDRVQLGQLRTRFVNQRVLINGSLVPSEFLIGWQVVKEKKTKNGVFYEPQYLKEVPGNLVGRTGTFIAVQAPQDVHGATA